MSAATHSLADVQQPSEYSPAHSSSVLAIQV